MPVTLSEQDQFTVRTAAWGAVSLMSAAGAAGSAHKAATEGSIALTSATGLVGHVLAKAPKGLDGKTVAALADQVLPALTASMNLLQQQTPAEADNFRRTVLVAVDAATRPQQGPPSPTMTEMARKITQALDAASATPVAAADRGLTSSAAATGQDRPELQKAIQEAVDAGFAGVQARVHDEHGEWAGTAGVHELGANTPPPIDGHFWAGSITKTFTATLMLQLVADGTIELDAPVAGHLPELGLDERITVRMLLQHTSGLYNYTGELEPDGTFVQGIPSLGKDWVDNRLHAYQPEELVKFALSKPARFEPGTGFSYSNTNYTLASLLIERLTGRTYAEEMRRRILEPLGLTGTVAAGTSPDLPDPHAHGYCRYPDGDQWTVADVTRQNPTMLRAAGDLSSTTRDLHTFISALMGGRLLPAGLLAEMRKPYGPLGYGLGLFAQEIDGGTIYHHNGSAPGGYGALMYSAPDGSTTLTASLTMGDADVDMAEVFPKILDLLVTTVFSSSRPESA
ncbi:serine hydrolase domain-containing protein [Actinomadura sp. NTSP31]|uniref:serine hydrolase domain-containing protein n=1 Tax=Actinomadura sp. NTSP31 TaxID=1735447 RepID=UPI0035BF3741